jgi:hypothetical protein
MGLEKVIKKFVTEPFVWVCLAMVGVVLLGPAVANLARKVVGVGRDRGNVAEHSESINQVLPVSPNRQSGDQMAGSAQSAVRQHPVEFKSLPSVPREKSPEPRELYGSINDGSQTAVDSRTTLRRDQQELLDTIEKSEDIDSNIMPDDPYQDSAMDKPTVQQPIEKMDAEDFFDVDKMVADVKPETATSLLTIFPVVAEPKICNPLMTPWRTIRVRPSIDSKNAKVIPSTARARTSICRKR